MTDKLVPKPPNAARQKQPAAKPPTPPLPVPDLDRSSATDDRQDDLKSLGGAFSHALNSVVVNDALRAMWLPPGLTPDDRDKRRKAVLAFMFEFKPRDAIEGMMAAQAVATHAAAMECYRRAMIPDQPGEAAQALRKNAASMTRTFIELLDALDRRRGGTRQQVVRVERVQVAPGGQAIVGNVSTVANGAMGEGQGNGPRQEPHAPPARLAHDAALGAILPPMRGADPDRCAVPRASDEQPPMPNARRQRDRA